jgi:exosome complex RNA-binding protein Rrp4
MPAPRHVNQVAAQARPVQKVNSSGAPRVGEWIFGIIQDVKGSTYSVDLAGFGSVKASAAIADDLTVGVGVYVVNTSEEFVIMALWQG